MSKSTTDAQKSRKSKTNTVYAAATLAQHLKDKKLTLDKFAKKIGLKAADIEDANEKSPLLVVNDRLFTRATRYTDKDIPASGKAVLLSAYIETEFDGSLLAFAKQFGESHGFLLLAEKDGSMWLNGEIYQPIQTRGNWCAKRLDIYIDEVCNGNETAFSRVYQTSQQQMHRWIQRDCYFCNGEIYLRRTEKNPAPLSEVTWAVLLQDHISDNYGPGDDGIDLFAREQQFNPQQVKRYINYNAMWIHGDVYKNQSKFAEKGIKPDYALMKPKAQQD